MNIDYLREQTPGCNEVIHFNNAGSSLMPQPVYQAILDHLALEYQMGGYEAAALNQGKIAFTYESIAKMIGAKPKEIALVENATRAWDMAFYSFNFNPGDVILTSRSEYSSNYLALLQVANKSGATVDVVPDDEHGQICLKQLENRITEKVKLIALTQIPSSGGLVNPAEAVGKIANQANIPFLLDACQAIGQMPVNVNEIGCDILTATGRKFLRGPRGTGFLYIRQELISQLEPPFIDITAASWPAEKNFQWHETAKRFETFECFVAGRIGLGVAAQYAQDIGLEFIQQRVTRLAASLRENLSQISGVQVQDQGLQQSGIVTFTLENKDEAIIRQELYQDKINISMMNLSMARLDLEPRKITNLLRASIHYYNTENEIESFCKALDAKLTQ